MVSGWKHDLLLSHLYFGVETHQLCHLRGRASGSIKVGFYAEQLTLPTVNGAVVWKQAALPS
jgi:hypothetical protein